MTNTAIQEEETQVRTFDSGIRIIKSAHFLHDKILIEGPQVHPLREHELVLVIFPHPAPNNYIYPPGFYIVKVKKANHVMCTRKFDVIGYQKPNRYDLGYDLGYYHWSNVDFEFDWVAKRLAGLVGLPDLVYFPEENKPPHKYISPHNRATHKAIRDRHSKPNYNNTINQAYRQQR